VNTTPMVLVDDLENV